MQFATQAPALVVVLSAPVVPNKIPVWEQQLSAGAACMNLLHAAHAMGFAGGWLTGWAAYSDAVRDLFGEAPQTIAG
ncbi:nitroreductase family protein, partial [Klebsiella pneumoniae]|uniref:nitroreductase family protein n=1 Tax=Klebsiella pneumoniae TaxID=573 RepID=UPI001D0E2EB8